MDRFRRKKLKAPLSNEGSHQIYKQRSTQNCVLDSSSYGSSEYSMAHELDRISSGRVSALPVKKLLAEEMSKDTDAKRRSPSVVAKLMGLDGLPSQQPAHRQHKTSNQMTTSVVSKIKRDPYEYRPYMNSSNENPEFKDVYEVSEAKGCLKRNSESDMSFISQKFMDAKRLSADDKFHNSKEFFDTLDALDSNKDHLIKFLQQPDSLYTKHLHDLQGAFPMYVYDRARPFSEKWEDKTMDLKSKKGISSYKNRYRREHHDGLSSNSFSPCSSNRSPKSSESRFKEHHQTEIRQTKIVVLKPNLQKQNAKKPVSLHRKHVEYPSNVSKGIPGDGGFSRPNMRESRERAKVVTKRISKIYGNEPIDLASIYQGYAGDESSYSVSGSESGSELEETMLSSRKSFHRSNRWNSKASYSHNSSISREAKKRLSQRWGVSHIYLGIDSVGEVRNLGEMLDKPDRGMRRDKLDPMLVPDMSRDRDFVDNNMNSGNLLDNNYRGDWKDHCVRNVSKSGFVSDSSMSCCSPESRTRCRKHNQGENLLSKEFANRQRNKAIKENVYSREDSSFKNHRSRNPKLQFHCRSVDSADIVENDSGNLYVGKKITSAEVPLKSEIPISNVCGPCLMTEAKVDIEHESKAFSCGSVDFSVKPSSCLSGINNYSSPGLEDSKQQVHEMQSPESSNEADHPSPISVLQAPPTEDISFGSKCFEELGADLHELRKQLKLLRMESGPDGGDLGPSDKDDSQGSFSDIEENAVSEHATWQTSYLDDALKESGFDSTDPNMILAIWHSLECPIAPWVFDKLEKKYLKDKTTSRSDRVLLFDRINCGIAVIFQWLVDAHPWVETGRRKFNIGWEKNGTRYELAKLLSSEENDTGEKMIKEMECLDFGDEVDIIGQEIETLLLNELIDEVANV